MAFFSTLFDFKQRFYSFNRVRVSSTH